MKMKLDIDTDKFKALAADYKQPGAADRIRNNPKGELAKLGIQIDDETEGKLKKRLTNASATAVAASAVHVDV